MADYISELEYQLLLEKVQSKKGGKKLAKKIMATADPEPESVLMGRIMKYCKDAGFPTQCFRPSRKAIGFLTPGWPD